LFVLWLYIQGIESRSWDQLEKSINANVRNYNSNVLQLGTDFLKYGKYTYYKDPD